MVVTPTRCWNCLISWRAEVRNLASRFDSGSLGPRPAVKQMTDAEQLRGPFDLFADLRARRALRLQRKGDVVANREMRIEPVALKHHRHAAGARRDVVDDGAADEKVAAGLLLEPADDAQKRGLAAA